MLNFIVGFATSVWHKQRQYGSQLWGIEAWGTQSWQARGLVTVEITSLWSITILNKTIRPIKGDWWGGNRSSFYHYNVPVHSRWKFWLNKFWYWISRFCSWQGCIKLVGNKWSRIPKTLDLKDLNCFHYK